MKPHLPHPNTSRLPDQSAHRPDVEEFELDVCRPAVTRACCCSARPLVSVILPPGANRPRPVDLYLCGHHYRQSRAALRAVDAIIVGMSAEADRLL